MILTNENESNNSYKLGILEIDRLIQSQIPLGYTLLFEGDLGTGADALCLQMIKQQLHENNKALIILTDPSSKLIFQDLVKNPPDGLYFLDATRTNIEGIAHKSEFSLYDIRIKISQAIENIENRDSLNVYFWSLNPLLINFSSRDVLHYLFKRIQDSVINRFREFYFIQSQITDLQVIRALGSLVHGVIQLSNVVSESDGLTTQARIVKLLGCRYFSNSVIIDRRN